MVQSGPLVVRLDHAEINGSALEEKENIEKRGGDVRETGPCSYFVACSQCSFFSFFLNFLLN